MMIFRHPKYYAELRKLRRELKGTSYPDDKHPSSQAGGGKRPNQRTRVQASSQSPQAPESSSQGTSAQAHEPGCKRQE